MLTEWGAEAGYVLFIFLYVFFLCGIFNNTINSWEYSTEQLSHYWVMSWEWSGRYSLWPNLRKYLRNCLEEMRTIMIKLNTAALWTEILIQDVQNIQQACYKFTNSVTRYTNFIYICGGQSGSGADCIPNTHTT